MRKRFVTVVVLACCVFDALAESSASFAALEPTASAAEVYRIRSEVELAASPNWTDLETLALQHAQLTRGSFSGAGGAKIHYRLYRHRAESRGAVVIVSGRTEGLALYQETIHDLVRNGWSAYIHDHRGQGFSQRLLSSDDTMGHIDDFDHYVEDLAAFIDGPVRDARGGDAAPVFLLAHSMGGAIAALYLEGAPSPSIAAAALVTPMLEPWAAGGHNSGVAAKLADLFCDRFSMNVAPDERLSQIYAEGAAFDVQYAAVRAAPPDAPNDLTHSAARFARHWRTRDEARCEGADCGSPHAKVGGVSLRWFDQSCNASQRARGAAAANIALPVLLLQGEADTVVKPSAQKQFCETLNAARGRGYCVGRTIAEARHSVLIEADAWRVPALRRVFAFFDCGRSKAARCD